MYWLAHIGYTFASAELLAILFYLIRDKRFEDPYNREKFCKKWGLARFSLYATLIGALGPDIIDKVISMQVVGYGRYIGHTLLFDFCIALLVFLIFRKKHRIWMGFILGWQMHLLLDSGGFLPLFFPFKQYDFSYEYINFFQRLITVPSIYLNEIGGLISIILLIILYANRKLNLKFLIVEDLKTANFDCELLKKRD